MEQVCMLFDIFYQSTNMYEICQKWHFSACYSKYEGCCNDRWILVVFVEVFSRVRLVVQKFVKAREIFWVKARECFGSKPGIKTCYISTIGCDDWNPAHRLSDLDVHWRAAAQRETSPVQNPLITLIRQNYSLVAHLAKPPAPHPPPPPHPHPKSNCLKRPTAVIVERRKPLSVSEKILTKKIERSRIIINLLAPLSCLNPFSSPYTLYYKDKSKVVYHAAWIWISRVTGIINIPSPHMPSDSVTLLALQTPTDIHANTVDPDETAHMSRLIWIYTVCHSVCAFWQRPLFATVGVPKFKDGRAHFRNSGMKGLTVGKSADLTCQTVLAPYCETNFLPGQ